MVDKNPLTESELEFLEFFYDPTAMTECLIPDGDIPFHNWPDCRCVTIRDYQFAMQNYSYVLADDPKLSDYENVRFKKGAGDLFSIGSRNTGKCEIFSNQCQLADGSLKTFGELINKKEKIISFNEDTLKLEQDIATFKDNGIQPCYKIITYSGKEIIVTENHPLYTNNGWEKSKDIKVNTLLATPRKININGIDINDNVAKIIGYLLGDGSCTNSSKSVTNINQDIIKELYELAEFFQCKIHKYEDAYFFSKLDSYKGNQNDKCIIALISSKYGLDTLSKNKIIHPEIFKWSNRSIALMLNRLFACDGHINKINYYFEITLASKYLIYQIQTLLLRFGIHSNILYKKAKFNNNFFDAWRLYVDSDVEKLQKEIGIFTKDNFCKSYKKYESSDILPKNLINKYRWELEKPSILSDKREFGFSRNKIKNLVNEWYHPKLYKLSHSDIYWEKITNVEFVGKLPTVMVSVEKNHTYISNNIISHNSYFLKIDIILSYIHAIGQSCLASFDFKHLNKVASELADALESHKFLKIFALKDSKQSTVKRKEGIQVTTQHGFELKSVNEKSGTDEAGMGFWGLHYNTLWYEEASEMSKEGTEKRIDAGNILGYIERISGIPNLCAGSPLTKIFNNPKMKNWIWRLPQYCMMSWNNEIEANRLEFYNGKSAAYKLNVEAEILEGAFGFIDIDRFKVASTKNVNRKVKHFDIDKETYPEFENLIIIEKLPGAVQCFIDADIGHGSAPTEIMVHFYDGTKYKYHYNITLNRLIIKEQAKIFKFIYDKVGGAFISADSTCGNGELIDELYSLGIPNDHLLKVKFTENIEIGFEKDEKDTILLDSTGNPIMKLNNTEDWSFKEMERLFYNGQYETPEDAKYLYQITNILAKSSKGKMFYDNKGENHNVQAAQCFFINRFFNEFKSMKDQRKKRRCFGVVNIRRDE